MSNKNFAKQLWEEVKIEFCNQHAGGGLTWWDFPLDKQPNTYKIEMYNIFYNILKRWSNENA